MNSCYHDQQLGTFILELCKSRLRIQRTSINIRLRNYKVEDAERSGAHDRNKYFVYTLTKASPAYRVRAQEY